MSELSESNQRMIANAIIHENWQTQETIRQNLSTPHIEMKPKIYLDGNKWCALYGEDLERGVAGFGNSPWEAMDDFDKSWWKQLGSNNDN